MRHPARALLLVLAPIAGLAAQVRPAASHAALRSAATLDPYTGNDPVTMRRLGYLSFGPFAWSDDADTDTLVHALGAPRLRCVETAHFKIASTMAPRAIPSESRLRRKVTTELQTLRKRLPGLERRTRQLDRWLLLHLYAQRMEQLYASFCRLLDVSDADFPQTDAEVSTKDYMGDGRFLGQRGKYTIILFDSQLQLRRYLQKYAGYHGAQGIPCRHEFLDNGSLAFATASQCHGGMLFGEVHMHSHVAGEVVKLLAAGYKSNKVNLPTWWSEGLGHWISRGIDERIVLMDESADTLQFGKRGWDWTWRVRRRLRNGADPSVVELLDNTDPTQWRIGEHMMAWSRFEFLVRRDPLGVRRYLDVLSTPKLERLDANAAQARGLQERALRAGWGLDFDEFDATWSKSARRRAR